MAVVIRAIYEQGNLRLLEHVDLEEGQQVRVRIEPTTELDAVEMVLADMLVPYSEQPDDSDAWVEDLAGEIDRAFQGSPSLSAIIIQERG